MKFVYGGYPHPVYEVNVEKFERFPKYSARNQRRTALHRLTFSGELQYYGQNAITGAINALEQAYNFDRAGDIGLMQDDGTRTPHFLYDATSINGVRITFFDYPQGDPAEYATKRTFRIVAEAEYLAEDDFVVSFEESLIFLGNTGPNWYLDECANASPIAVQVSRRTVQHVVQSGRIVGLISYMGAPPPVFSNGEHQNRRVYSPESPVKYGNLWLDWPERYEYHFSFGTDSSASASPTIL